MSQTTDKDEPMSEPEGQVFELSVSASGVVGQGAGDPPPGSDNKDEEQP